MIRSATSAPTTTWFRRGSFARRRSPVGAASRSRSRSPSTTTFGRTSSWRCRSSRVAGAPATFFLTGASLQGPASFWWERLDRALDSDVGSELLGTGDPDRAVATVAALPASEREELSTALLERLGGEEDRSGLRSEHVAELAAAGCEIGFHTRDHERLTTLGDAALGRAMRDGADELERAAGMSLRCIAYPFGDADDRVAAAARDAGFDSGFTTRGTAVRAGADPFLMGRLYPSEASIAHLASQLSLAAWRAARGR